MAAGSTESAIRERRMLERNKELGVLPGQVKANSIWLQIRESDGRVLHRRDQHCIAPGPSKEDDINFYTYFATLT